MRGDFQFALLAGRGIAIEEGWDSISGGPLGARSSCTHIFQTAQEVVANRRARQVGCVQAAPYVEEIIGAQHGVVLLSVARGGENPVH